VNALVTLPEQPLPTTLRITLESAADLASNSRAASTRAAYDADFRIFSAWCHEHGLSPMPAIVAAFLADQVKQGRKPSTLGRRLASINDMHRMANEDSPTDHEKVKTVLAGAKRSLDVAPRKLASATSEKVIGMATLVRVDIGGLRDRAILLLGFSLAARRSELVALDVDDLEFCDEGASVRIRRSKTDQEGAGGAVVAVCRRSMACPVETLRAHLDAAGITSGAMFRRILRRGHITEHRLDPQTVCKLVKEHAAKLGLDPAQFRDHTLGAGFATSSPARGANLFKIMNVTRHKSVDTLRGYVRDQELFTDHAGAGLL
jgi:site-specific recombinase XerD